VADDEEEGVAWTVFWRDADNVADLKGNRQRLTPTQALRLGLRPAQLRRQTIQHSPAPPRENAIAILGPPASRHSSRTSSAASSEKTAVAHAPM
jgi:hypothetical protein